MEKDLILSNGELLTDYLATVYAEETLEGENALLEDQLKAWAYLIKTGLCWNLQGWFGRKVKDFINEGYINEKGIINWDMVNRSME